MHLRLSLPQQDVYYEQLLYPGEPIYNIGAKIAVRGTLHYDVLSRAYAALIDQHDAYRSVVVQDADGAQVRVLPTHDSVLGFVDFSAEADPDARANRYMQETFTQAFDFNEGALLHRFVVVKVSDAFHYLFSMYHHIITDGWGTSLMFSRWVENYNELLTTGRLAPRPLYSYGDFVADDARYAASAEFAEDRQYWKDKFRDLPERLFTPIHPGRAVNRSRRRELIVPRPRYNQLEALAATLKGSAFHVILAVLYLYLGRRYRNRDFAVGLPVLNRGKSAFKKTVGLFMGVSPLRMQFSLDDTFADLVGNVKQQLRRDYRHQRFPLGKLVQELDAFGEKDRLFNVTVSYEKQNYADHFRNTQTRVIPLTHGAERVALAIYVRDFDEAADVKIDFDYHVNYFDDEAAAALVTHFGQLLEQVCADPERKLSDYRYLTRAEEDELLHTFNQTQWEYPRAATWLTFFARQVAGRPGQPAVADDADQYTYGELDALSDRIARHLLTLPAVRAKAPIAVLMPRSARLVATLLGVQKAGTAYIPLDPDFPAARLAYIAGHSQAACILGTRDQRDALGAAIPFLCLDDLVAGPPEGAAEALPEVSASDTAYVIYTSGSTGTPKGVEIGHQSLANFLGSIRQRPGLTPQDVLFSVTTQSFDISILEFFAPLLAGATLYVAPKPLQADPGAMMAALEARAPTVIQATPSFYQFLYNAGWKGDKGLRVLCGGDLLSAALAEKLLGTCAEVWNLYGPTETTIWSSVKQIRTPEDAANIGRPIHNTQFYVLDEARQLLPAGCPGALYIGGLGLAKGYYKNEALTAGKFVPNPFRPGEKMYETGDLGQWNRQGEIEFLGRNDQQVKIRGYRIELGEIEAKLNQMDLVRSSVVVARRGASHEACLVAYVVLSRQGADPGGLVNALRKELPEYMIPYRIVPVEAFPLTPNQKVDRKLLAAREVQPEEDVSLPADPETSLETALCGVFREALGWNGKIGVTDHFFALGGHSLNAMKAVNQIQQQLHYRASLRDVFNHPTVQTLAARLREQGTVAPRGIEATPDRPHYPVTPAQYAIWLAAQQGPHRSSAYNLFVVYEIQGEIDPARLQQAFAALIGKYEILRTNFVEIEGVPHQKVTPAGEARFHVDVVAAAGPGAVEAYVNAAFDLENDRLLRAGLFQTGGAHLLAFASHHVLLDGWSVGEMVREVGRHYRAPGGGIGKSPFQFRDYAAWLHQNAAERQDRNERFWKEYLRDYRWETILPAIPGGAGDEYPAAEHHFRWEGDFLAALQATARRQNHTPHTLLLTAFVTLLHKTTGRADVCIGTVNSGRTIAGLHDQVGMFVKTLPLRAKYRPGQAFSARMQAVHNDLLETDAHQDLPESISNTLALDVLFVLQPTTFNYDHIALAADASLRLREVAPRYSRLPLLVNFMEGEESLRCVVSYRAGEYDQDAIELLFLRYESLLAQVAGQPDVTTGDLDVALAFEKEQAIDIPFNF